MKELTASIINAFFVIVNGIAFCGFGYKYTHIIFMLHVIFLLAYIITSTENKIK